MADKEHTVFLLDATVPHTAYKYVFDTLAGKLLKGLKTDYVSLALFHSSVTQHEFADKGKYIGIEVLLDFEAVSFSSLRQLSLKLTGRLVLNGSPHPDSANMVQTVLFASTLFAPTKKKAFTRNIVLVSRGLDAISESSLDKIALIPTFYAEYPVNFYAITSDDTSPPENSALVRMKDVFSSGLIFTTTQAHKMVDFHPPIRKTRPIATYMGALRLGADFDRVIEDDSYDFLEDDLCVSFRVELYPAAKSDTSIPDTHEYVVDSNKNIVRLERNTSNFVWEKNFQGHSDPNKDIPEPADPSVSDPEKKFDKKTVDPHSLTPAFKFSNFDLLALDDDLLLATKLRLFSAFDVFGFIPAAKLPYEYLTGEASYVVPEKASSLQNTVNFQAFVEALYIRKLAVLCRFVRKAEKEVEIGAAFPVKVKSDQEYANCLVFVRLPYKEDEKIGRFPPLSASKDEMEDGATKNESGNLASIALLMDDFVRHKTYEDKEEDETDEVVLAPENSVIDNFKVIMRQSDSSKLALPRRHASRDPFLCSSPSVNRTQAYLRRILLKSLSADDWVGYFENPDFIADTLRELEEFTNFFNLENCLSINSNAPEADWLLEINNQAISKSKRLALALGSKYVRKAETKKSKSNKATANFYQKGNYGADEGNYDEVPEFGF